MLPPDYRPEQEIPLYRTNISDQEEKSIGLNGRYGLIKDTIAQHYNFMPDQEPFREITWWNGEKIGAVLYRGTLDYKGQIRQAVLKIEGVKTAPNEISEAKMIQRAEKALAGSGIRPPRLYVEIPWTHDQGGYSAFFMEAIPTAGNYVLPVPASEEQINEILRVREKYRAALQNNHTVPWVTLDSDSEEADYLPRLVESRFTSWKAKRKKPQFWDNPFRKDGDEVLIDKAITVLKQAYFGVAPKFQQTHFSHEDIVKVDDEYIMFSNLYWDWLPPLYDLAFVSHWYMYALTQVPGMTIGQLEQQYELWNRRYANTLATLSPEDNKLFTLARIERLAAGLNLDVLTLGDNLENPIDDYAVKRTRNDLISLLNEASR